MALKRAALKEIDSNSRYNKELSLFDRGQIIGQARVGCEPAYIAEGLDVKTDTVRKTIQRHPYRPPNGASKPRSGRPKVLDKRTMRRIRKYAAQNHTCKYREIKHDLGLSCSATTISRFMISIGLTHWISLQRPKLTEHYAKLRLLWATAVLFWVYKWRTVIFSDECSVERGAGRRRVWTWGRAQDRYKPEFINLNSQGSSGKSLRIMIWGAIWYGGRSNVVICQGDSESKRQGFSANSYINILEDQLPLIYKPGMRFMHDNSKIHTAKKVKLWLEQHGIWIFDHPAYSPDMNPIEHIWSILKQQLVENHEYLFDMGTSEQAYQALKAAIEQEWRAIDQEVINSIISSMPSRVDAVLDARGWYTKY